MYILGINGWCTRSHDPSACLVEEGKILAMAEEERFIRQKYAFEKVPINAIGYCLDEAGIDPDEVGAVAHGWDYQIKYARRKISFPCDRQGILDVLFPRRIFKYTQEPKLLIVPHHLAHAASAFFTSGLDESAILVVDGQGEDVSTTIAYGRGKKIKILKTFPIKDSLGYFYESVNKYIGFSHLDSGKTMGLAPYGRPIYDFRNIELSKAGYTVQLPGKLEYDPARLDEQEALIALWHKEIARLLDRPNTATYRFDRTKNKMSPVLKISSLYQDLAASAQAALERCLDHLAGLALKMTGSKNLCLSGGVGLNCTANGGLSRNPQIETLHIFPAANDTGVSAGAALSVAASADKKASFSELKHVYLGPGYSRRIIERILEERKIRYKVSKNICRGTARLLAKNKVVGWFQGKMEIGPRSLGNRSILASPLLRSTWPKVNAIKGREVWRPLSPSVLDEYKEEYFEKARYSPFMLKSFQVKRDKRKIIPAVVHIDGSARPQTVSLEANKKYWQLINEFYKITGVPVLLNTSFNGPGEPIVCSPRDALAMFFNSGLDYLVMADFIIAK